MVMVVMVIVVVPSSYLFTNWGEKNSKKINKIIKKKM